MALALRELLPPMRVVVAAGDGEVTIKVADEGGGLPRSRLRGVWSYRGRWAGGHADPALQGKADLHGLGLPIARLYAKYFGGSLALVPIEGHGTDCYVTFNRLPEENAEQIQPRSSREPLSGSSSMNIFDAQSRRAY